MKKTILIALLACLPILFYGQTNTINTRKNETMNFYEIQKNFNKYWAPLNVKNGKYVNKAGEKVKAPGWKPFKRWEWFWESRINKKTGEFPTTAAWKEFENYKSALTNKKSSPKSNTANWTNLGTSNTSGGYAGLGRLNCVAFHPSDNNTFWTGSPSGGLWKTTNGGSSWTVLTDNNAVLGVSDIVIPTDYATSNTIYIATGDRDGGSMWSIGGSSNDNNTVGVLKSTDGGNTWTTTNLIFSVDDNDLVTRLLLDPDDNQTITAATSNGVYKTTDGGSSWTKLSTYSFIDMEFKPGNKQIIYGSTKEYSYTKIYRSTDGGDNWTQIQSLSGKRTELAVSPDEPSWVYAIVANSGRGLKGIYKSTDSGASFSNIYDGSDTNQNMLGYFSDGSGGTTGQGAYDLCIASNPSNANEVYIGGVNSWKSTNGGTSWTCINMWTGSSYYNKNRAAVVHADKHFMAYQNSSTLFECNDGGIYKTTNEGVYWTDLTNGTVISQIYRLGVSQQNSNDVICGLQDNGTKLYSSASWDDVKGGDGMECIIDYTDNNVQYGTYVRGEIERTTNHWGYGTIISNNIDDEDGGAWVTPYIIDPNENKTLYVGYADVWKTTDRGDSFTKISTMNSSEKLRSMAIAPSNSQVLYVANQSTIWKTTNGGTSWTTISSSLPSSNSITYLAVKHDDPNTVWVTFGGYDSNRIYKTTDGGSSWSNISSGLPNLPVMSVVQNRQNTEEELFVGADIGVYKKIGTNDWELFSNKLPNVVVTEVEIYYDDDTPENSKLRAATFGRGLWETIIPNAKIPESEFSANTTTVGFGGHVSFTDNSINKPVSWLWTFEGATPSSSAEQNPQNIIYNTEGTFDVTLVATNSAGADKIIKPDYITVSEFVPPSNLTAELDYNVTTLNWDKPQLEYNPYSIDFEGQWAPEGWQIKHNTSLDGSNLQDPTGITWDLCSENSFEGQGSKYIHSGNFSTTIGYTAPDLNWLISPEITIGDNELLHFWIYYLSNNDDVTKFHVMVYDNASWKSILDYRDGTPANDYETAVDIDLSTYAGKKIKFAFVYEYNDGFEMAIDDIMVGTSDNFEKFETKKHTKQSVERLAYDNVKSTALFTKVENSLRTNTFDKYYIYRNSIKIDSISDVNTSTYSDIISSAGEYVYSVSSYYSSPVGESPETNTQTITILPLSCAFTADEINACINNTVVFTDTSYGAIKTYSWNFGEGASPATANTVGSHSVTYSTLGQKTVSLTITGVGGSDSEIKNEYISVSGQAVAGIVTADADTICENSIVTLNLSGYSGNIQWQESENNKDWNNITNANSDTYISGELETTNYYRAKVATGCSEIYSETRKVVVNKYAVGGTSYSSSDFICEGRITSIILSGSTGDKQWQSSPDGSSWTNIVGETHAIYNTPRLNANTYYRAFVSVAYCGQEYSNVTVVNVSENPVGGTASAVENSVCAGNSVLLNVSDYMGTIQWQQSNDSIKWSDINNATTEEITSPPITESTFYRAEIFTKGCNEAYSSVVKVNAKPLPVSDFDYNAVRGLINFVDNSQNAETYFWDFGDGATSTEKEPTHNYLSNNNYDVLQKVNNECGRDSIIKHLSISGVGINEIDPNEIITIYPNPNNGTFSIKYSSKEIGSIIIELYNIEGKLMFSKNYEKQTKELKADFNLQTLSKGIYQFRVIGLKKVTNKQILIR
ncbi:MAG: PKD domain-containing protein [Bacteroidetes bacterium]|nr:PKD domain-containing protein [Bacteroidota bacterium]